jgi:hypothetical protein
MIKVSKSIERRADNIYKSGTPKKSTTEFDVFEVPSGFLDHLALLIFKEGKDFLPGTVPDGTLIIPVNIENRHGYMMDKIIAFSYDPMKTD